ncbi:alpha-(1-_3)-arabinofuranosyltransferase domain-containing protein [Corynebacterium sp. S7]
MVHLVGWVFLTLLSFLQEPGRTAADTKLDLALDPAGFLGQATSAYTDTFTLGQIQNQAYGYLFPQGLFFLLTEPLPDWVAQRAWWALLMGIAFSGTVILVRKMGISQAVIPTVVPAVLYALSPRILTTLTAISSEAWPVALVPWTLIPLVGKNVTWKNALIAVIPVALMGAVNATATLMACIPAGLLLLWRKQFKALAIWLAGCAAVSAWWIGPLLVLGRYSPPFTDYIESSYTTTYWLNLAEIFRGTTSWAPFVETERIAGNLLVTEPVFVLATMAVAALGFAGLASKSMPWRGYLVLILCVGVALMGMAHGPFGQAWISLLDDSLAPFRNLHKLDPLVRLPLVLGVAHILTQVQWKRVPVLVAVVLITVTATAPAWSLRLAPEGTWEEVPSYWYEAAAFVDKHAADTRTLVLPEASFARQDWGWTRDEPIQALTEVPFAVRDAIPLVDPEAIRGLDGAIASLGSNSDPEDASEALRAIGVGVVLVRHDLENGPANSTDREWNLPGEKHTFGEIDVYLIEPERDMMITSDAPVTVAGGGESLGLLNSLYGYSPRELVASDAQIVTDTPALAVRNYGTLIGPVSAHLRDLGEGSDVRNRVPDYESAGPRVGVVETGGSASASSSAADASSFGGAQPSRSLTAAFDGRTDTAWWPQPGDTGWIESSVEGGSVTITATQSTRVRVISGSFDKEVSLSSYSPRSIRVPGDTVRIELSEPVGIAELDTGVTRLVTVPDTSPNAQVFMFQRLMPNTTVLQRGFTTHNDETWQLSAPATIDGEDFEAGPVDLPAGSHVLETDAEVITLERDRPAATWEPLTGEVQASDQEQTVVTTRAFNSGLRMSVGGTEISPHKIDAGQTAFTVPVGVSGAVEFSFVGTQPYRLSLLIGGVLGALTLVACIVLAVLSRRTPQEPQEPQEPFVPENNSSLIAPVVAAILVGGPWGLAGVAGVALTWAVRRFTLIPAWGLAGGLVAFMGLWLARAPWPEAGYAGTSLAVTVAGCAVLACLGMWNQRKAGRSTNS